MMACEPLTEIIPAASRTADADTQLGVESPSRAGPGSPAPGQRDLSRRELATPTRSPADQLILGDNLAVMSALLPEYEGRINLIYADPPFFTNRRYPTRIGRGEDSRRPQDWQLAEGYPDALAGSRCLPGHALPALALMHRLLAADGTLYLHLDWHADHYARLLLDEIFGPDRLLNEIIWVYHGPSPIRRAFNRKHDTLLAYTKSDGVHLQCRCRAPALSPQYREDFRLLTQSRLRKSARPGTRQSPRGLVVFPGRSPPAFRAHRLPHPETACPAGADHPGFFQPR